MSTVVRLLIDLPADDQKGIADALRAAADRVESFDRPDLLTGMLDPNRDHYLNTTVGLDADDPTMTLDIEHSDIVERVREYR